jgi:hypothetical protein
MKQILAFFIVCLSFSAVNAQYYLLPDWVEDLPYPVGNNEIYAVGVSDPRMTDKILAKDVALNRAIAMAVMFEESQVYYASDYFEKRSEEYRWLTMKEDVEELGKVHAAAWIDDKSYQIISTDENTNGETVILIKYTPSSHQDTNFIVSAEYYRQDFEVSNTRAMESIRSIKLSTSWKKSASTDTLKTFFHMTNWNNSVSSEITYNGISIAPPGYSYEYAPSIPDNFDLKIYNTSTSLKKGLWIAYIDSYMQSVMKISKNFNSKMQTVYDDYKVNRDDGITEYSTESLARSVCKNVLSFEYGGMGIHKNHLYPRVFLKNEREFFVSSTASPQTDTANTEKVEKKCWLKRLFSKKEKSKKTRDE